MPAAYSKEVTLPTDAPSLLGYLSLAVWIYLFFFRGWFWRLPVESDPFTPPAGISVAAIIPARNEADVIGRAVSSLQAQNYGGPLSIFVVDDHSTDGTANLAKGATVIQADSLPPGWTGKLWALHCGLRHAAAFNPDYFLLTDADIVHSPHNLASLVARAERDNLDLASIMVKLRCDSFAERALIPAFLFFFLKLYPPAWRTGAAGGCILIRPSALHRIGGVAAIRDRLIDDCALAERVRRHGKIWMGVSSANVSIREYKTFGEIGRMIARSAFTQLRYSTSLLAGTLLGLTLSYLIPPILGLSGHYAAAAAWILMAIAFLPTLRLYRRSLLWAPALPAIALFYMGATIQSAIQHWTGKGGQWKGRIHDRY